MSAMLNSCYYSFVSIYIECQENRQDTEGKEEMYKHYGKSVNHNSVFSNEVYKDVKGSYKVQLSKNNDANIGPFKTIEPSKSAV